jgi:nucleoside-diphosphate-sugar epimerase
MKVFITGASGFVGTAVTKELVDAGHSVVGLARSEESAHKLTAMGVDVLRGTIEDVELLSKTAQEVDAVIHLAYIHDFSNYQASALTDKKAIDSIGEALVGSNKPFIVTAGTAGIAVGRVATEHDLVDPNSPRFSESAALAYADRGVRVSVLRLPPSVHGISDMHGFIPTLIGIARAKGSSGYPVDGVNRWAAVHVSDAAALYRLALESAPAGSRLQAVGDEGITTKNIAELIGKHLDLPVQSIPQDQINMHFGWIGMFFALDIPATSVITQELLDWHPTHPGLVEDLESGFYFNR